MTESKKALLIISYGTRYPDARKSIENIEKYICSKYPDHDFFRAFTSKNIIHKIKVNENIQIATPSEALQKIIESGYTELICQPLYVICGTEYEIVRDLVLKSLFMFDSVSFGHPLLTHISDYEYITKIYKDIAAKYEFVVLVGHGTAHQSNSAYCMLEEYFRYSGINNVYVGTIESFPSIEYIKEKLVQNNVTRVTLIPFMIVAGNHAKEDIAGENLNSWESVLKESGFDVNILMKSLGQFTEISELFYHHTKNK